jgi:Polysaccharide deacetylase
MAPTPISVTFEAGGDPGPFDGILEALRTHGSRATFFLDGRWAEKHPELVQRVDADGHELANHGYAHPDWTTLTDDEIAVDLQTTEALAAKLTHRSTKPWARPPYGAIDSRVSDVLDQNGYKPFYRDAVDGAHWPGVTTVHAIVQRALQAADADHVIVFHTNSRATEEALPQILRSIREHTEIVPLSELDFDPPPRAARHPTFSDLEVTPGYVCPSRPGGRWHSLNVLELGSHHAYPANSSTTLTDFDGERIDLLVGDPEKPWSQPATGNDRYILMVEGALRCDLESEGQELGYLIARSGDLFLWPRETAARLTATGDQPRRWIGLVCGRQ